MRMVIMILAVLFGTLGMLLVVGVVYQITGTWRPPTLFASGPHRAVKQ
jgi:hypothetical protein